MASYQDRNLYEDLCNLCKCIMKAKWLPAIKDNPSRLRSFERGADCVNQAIADLARAARDLDFGYGGAIIDLADKSNLEGLRDDEWIAGLTSYSRAAVTHVSEGFWITGGLKNLESMARAFEDATSGIQMSSPATKQIGRLTWKVLAEENGMQLLVTENCIGKRPWNSKLRGKLKSNHWNDSKIKEYLNGEFVRSYLSGFDTSKLCDRGYGKVFLLSEDEARQFFRNDVERKCGDLFGWWLRTVDNRGVVKNVLGGGGLSGCLDSSLEKGIRPAIWLKL